MLSEVIRSALGYPAFTVGTISGTPEVRPSRSSRTRESPRWQRADIEVPNIPVDVSSWGRSTSLGFDGGLKKPPTDALRPIIPDNACILCITATAGTELADAYSPDTVIASSPGKEESGPYLSPSVADPPLGPATDHRLGKLLPHQLANQTRAPPREDSSFCSSTYGVLAAVSSCCFPPKGRFLRITHPSATGNTTSRPTCMC
ncbi:hypothetical protein E3N88_34590 [Mikania micrantha]|uniref:Uncharacterized protein n=1 Tax=Mikania micrantha TaxID=192012 RepID=A0A5N6LYK4_9ASTR|nr:hypothetical protein E3N88_34590 [Mikania micrantha]